MAGENVRESLNRQTYVADRIHSVNKSVVADADNIHEAIAKDRKISFLYFHYLPNKDNPKTYSKSGDRVVVSPYALMWNDGNAYDGNNFHIYRVESISKPMPEQRNINDLYKENSMVSKKVKVFRIFLGKKTYNVRIRVRNELAGSDIDEF